MVITSCFNDRDDGKAVQKKMSEFTEDYELYTNLTDHVFQQILTSSDSIQEDDKKELEKVFLLDFAYRSYNIIICRLRIFCEKSRRESYTST